MKRLTIHEIKEYIIANYFDGDENVDACVDGDEEITVMVNIVKSLKKLAEYENAEKNGTLIRFSKEINLSLPVHQKFMIEICDGYTKLESIDLLDFTSTVSIEMEVEGQKYGEHINFYDTPVISMQDKGLVSGNLIQLMCLTLERLYAEKNKTTDGEFEITIAE